MKYISNSENPSIRTWESRTSGRRIWGHGTWGCSSKGKVLPFEPEGQCSGPSTHLKKTGMEAQTCNPCPGRPSASQSTELHVQRETLPQKVGRKPTADGMTKTSVYTYICIHTCTHTLTCAHTYTCMYGHTWLCTHTCAHKYAHAWAHVVILTHMCSQLAHVYTHAYTCMHVHGYTHTHAHMCVHKYTHVHSHPNKTYRSGNTC